MTPEWTDDQPIYRQLKEKVANAIMEGALSEGEALPSVRSVAVDLQINPITASKAYQELAQDGLVEKRRGLGMFIVDGARERLLEAERRRFLEEDWPRVVATIERLGLNAEDLVRASLKGGQAGSGGPSGSGEDDS
ncbi:GntR family transcriptional regulator [Yunchengibacter salinarum]|uniref:GntR family transcriptional regulator n=1 Tax=Yunchengibacter salinarum TaxID=3133399 RepID=UPI0035B5A46E